MSTFRIGPAPLQDRPSSQNLQNGTHLALQPAIQAIQPAANAQPALQQVTQTLEQATAQPALQPVTQILQQATVQPALQPITQSLQQATTQTAFQPGIETLQPVTQVFQPVISERSIQPTTADFNQQERQLVDQEPLTVEEANMSQQLYQIQGADGQPMIVTEAQLQALQSAAPQPQYVVQQPQPQQYVVQQPASRPTSVYYTQGSSPGQQVTMSNGQLVQPVMAPVGTTMAPVATTTAHGVPVVAQPQKDDDLLSFYDPSWYKKQTTAGSLTGSTLAWVVFALILLVLLLHVIAFGLPHWSSYQLLTVDTHFGLFQACDAVLGCHTPDFRLGQSILDNLKAAQAIAGIILAGLVILVVIFLIYLTNTQYKKNLEIITIVVTFITAILMLTLLSLWEVNVKRALGVSSHGASYILEIIAFVFALFICIIATIDYVLVTRKL